MSLYLLVVSYAAMALAGFLIQLIFQALGIVPVHRQVIAFESSPSLNYTSVLNVLALVLMAVLGWRFLRTGGLDMLRMMEMPAEDGEVSPGGSSQHQEHHHH
jgi:hypothetical protein